MQPTLDLGDTNEPETLPPGFRLIEGAIPQGAQGQLLTSVLEAVEASGWIDPVMPRTGAPYSVRMGNLGPLGWVSDRAGYRYQPRHPGTGRPWPPIPRTLLSLWDQLCLWPEPPECCLVNHYRAGAKMGLHQDRDEANLRAPVLSISLGDDAIYRLGGTSRGGPTRPFRLKSGDIVVLGGEARLCFHGVARIYPGTSPLVPGGGRINLTLRRVTAAAAPSGEGRTA